VSRPRDEDYLGPSTITIMIIRAMTRRSFASVQLLSTPVDLVQYSLLYLPIAFFHGHLLRHSQSIVCLDDIGFYVQAVIDTATHQVVFAGPFLRHTQTSGVFLQQSF